MLPRALTRHDWMVRTFRSPKDGQWYVRVVASNGRSVLVGGEGYKTRQGVERAVDRLMQHVGAGRFVRSSGPVRLKPGETRS